MEERNKVERDEEGRIECKGKGKTDRKREDIGYIRTFEKRRAKIADS